ncbi:hypothetical protein FQA39_LY15924 [Lamprigera yunnana]|nr:hypothetical protein FQA39_LY15924 [Lamprigera yunnana]
MNRNLPTELQVKAIEELNEVPDRIKDDIEKIREWLAKQQHLKITIDDALILSFLRGCKHSLQRTKEKIDYFYTMRTLLPEFYTNRDPLSSELQTIINAGTIVLLPKPDPKTGARIIMWAMKNSNPDTMPYSNLLIMSQMMMDILMKEDNNSIVCGIKVWIDLTDCSPKYFTQFTPVLLKKHIDCAEKGYPLRIKGMYVTNCPAFLEYTYHLVKSFAKSKIAKRLSLYKDVKDLYDEVPQNLMPQEFGGESITLDALKMAWKKKVESYRDWFLEDLKSKSDESLRLGEPKTMSNVFGVEGSFRKMNID